MFAILALAVFSQTTRNSTIAVQPNLENTVPLPFQPKFRYDTTAHILYARKDGIWKVLAGGAAGAAGAASADTTIIRVYLLFGQSNALGLEPNSSASAGELLPQNQVQIWNTENRRFEDLEIGVNNINRGDTTHGMELGFSLYYQNYYPGDTMYLIKYAVGSTAIETWTDGGANWETYYTDYVAPALDFLMNTGRKIEVSVLYHQGEANATSTSDTLTFYKKIIDWKYTLDTLFDKKIPIIIGEIIDDNNIEESINRQYSIFANNFDNVSLVGTESFTIADGQHFDYAGYKAMANSYLSAASGFSAGHKPDNYIKGARFINLKSVSGANCLPPTATLTVDIEYGVADDTIKMQFLDSIWYHVPASFYDNSDQFQFTKACQDTTGVFKLSFLSDSTIYTGELLTLSQDVNYTDSVSYDFEGYTVPTTDATKFTDWAGTHDIETFSTSKRIHADSSTPIDTLIWTSTPGFRFAEVPNSAADIQIELDLTYRSNYIILRATGTGPSDVPTGYMLRFTSSGISLYRLDGSGTSRVLQTSINYPAGAVINDEIRNYKITCTGNTITLIEDGVDMGEFEFTGTVYSLGTIAYGHTAGNGHIDNVVIRWTE